MAERSGSRSRYNQRLSARFTTLPPLAALVGLLGCGPGSGTSSDTDTGTDESDTGEGEPGTALTIVTVGRTGTSTQILAFDFDAEPVEPVAVVELAAGVLIYIKTPHGLVIQGGTIAAPEVGWLVRLADGAIHTTPVTPDNLARRVRDLDPTPSGNGALARLTTDFNLLEDQDMPGDCSVWWIEYDADFQPIGATELEGDVPGCTTELPFAMLDAAGELAVWIVAVGGGYELRATEINDGVPGPVTTLASFTGWWPTANLRLDDDKIAYTADLDDDGMRELVVHERAALDQPPTSYPFEGPSAYEQWSADGAWVVWRDNDAINAIVFDGLVPSAPFDLAEAGLTAASLPVITSEGRVRFGFAEGAGLAGVAEVELGVDSPGPLDVITAPLADGVQIYDLDQANGIAGSVYTASDEAGLTWLGYVGGGDSPTEHQVFETQVEAGSQAELDVHWPLADGRYLVVSDAINPELSIVDLDAPAPQAAILAEGLADDLPSEAWVRYLVMSPGHGYVVVTPGAEDTHQIWRVPTAGGAFEQVFAADAGDRVGGFWTLRE